MTADRNVTIVIQMQADQVEGTRKLCQSLAEFPVRSLAYLERVLALIESGDPQMGVEITRLLAELKENAHRVCVIREILKPFAEAAVISDPDGRKERLQ